MTTRDLINGSLRLLGVLAEGESATAAQAQDALAALNSMLDSWSTESLSVLGMTQQIVTLTQAQQMYTVGPGGDINIARPMQIADVSVVYPSGPQAVFLPLDEYNQDQYASIAVIGYQTPVPQGFYVNSGFPLTQLYIYPIPQAGTTLRFFTQDAILNIPDINQGMVFAPGYEKAVRYGLAIELAPEYDKEPSATVQANYALAKGNIQRLNAQDIILSTDVWYGRRGGWNRITGDWQ